LIPLFVSSTSSLTGKAASPCFAIVFAIPPFTRKPCYLRQQVCKFSPNCDGRERKCIRALANHYETTSQRRSTDCKPLMKPHRDNVNDADITFVLGITPTSDYCGAMLYVSKERDGKFW
jgi:hypothetical protein